MSGLYEESMRYGICDKKDQLQLKRLWKTAFHDTDAYIEYYFQSVVSRNIVFAAWDDKKLVSMIHLNPYTLLCQGKEIVCHYIVGVATLPEYQRKGIMKHLLQIVLDELRERGEGFTYLMPAKEEYYYRSGFQNMEPGYLFSWKDYISLYQDNIEDNRTITQNWRLLDVDSVTDVQWENFNKRLSEKYDLFAKRDADYMTDLKLQCESLSGDVYIVMDHHMIIATMGIMYEDGNPECVQYITTEDSLLPLLYVEEQLVDCRFSEIEIFGNWLKKRYPQIQTKTGKGIMYKVLDKAFSNVICCDKMLLINEIV